MPRLGVRKFAARSVKPPVQPLSPAVPTQPGELEADAQVTPEQAYDFSYLPADRIAVLRLFVSEYVKDFNGHQAVQRLGFRYKFPNVVANNYLKEPFTQYLIDQYIQHAEEKNIVSRNEIIMSLKREANNYGIDATGASRVAALRTLARIHGMEIQRTETNVNVAGGIMLVPVAATAEEWEKNAAEAQLKLREAAKS